VSFAVQESTVKTVRSFIAYIWLYELAPSVR